MYTILTIIVFFILFGSVATFAAMAITAAREDG